LAAHAYIISSLISPHPFTFSGKLGAIWALMAEVIFFANYNCEKPWIMITVWFAWYESQRPS